MTGFNPSPINPPSLVTQEHASFVIMDAPTDENLHQYIEVLQKHNVKAVVRVCDSTYDKTRLEELGMEVVDLPFPDGDAPPDKVISTWLDLCEKYFGASKGGNISVAVHCVAGLGRAPLLVAIALMERGLAGFDAVELIRTKRRGAINKRQLKYVESYKPTRNKKGCLVM